MQINEFMKKVYRWVKGSMNGEREKNRKGERE